MPHPIAVKAAQGRTKSRLITDPARGPMVTPIFRRRTDDKLSVATISWRLNGNPAAYPPPGDGWTEASVNYLLKNPKYTGYMVYGRTRKPRGATKAQRIPEDK
jgi:site-specific DNA recombinase